MPSPNDAPTSCKISEKTIERFLRKRVTDVRTDARDRFYKSRGLQPGTKNNQNLSF